MNWQNPLLLCLSAPYQLEMQIWQVTRSALVNLSRSGCAPLLLWHGICTQTTILILLGTWTGSHCFWWHASPCNNRLSLPWFCKPFPKRLKLAGQTKERLSTTCPSTPLSPIKSVVTTCTFNKLPVSFCLFFYVCVLSSVIQMIVSTPISFTFILLPLRAQMDLCLSVCDFVLHVLSG